MRSTSSTSVDLPVNGVWRIEVCADEAPVVTVTLPAGSTATPAVEDRGHGRYRAEYVVLTTGRYIARAVTAASGAADFTAYVTATVAGTAMPNVEDLDDYLTSAGGHSWSDIDLQDALDVEGAAQRGVCRVPAAYPADLRHALLRRAARNLALRKVALATAAGVDDNGDRQLTIPGLDREIRRYEAPYRKLVGA